MLSSPAHDLPIRVHKYSRYEYSKAATSLCGSFCPRNPSERGEATLIMTNEQVFAISTVEHTCNTNIDHCDLATLQS